MSAHVTETDCVVEKINHCALRVPALRAGFIILFFLIKPDVVKLQGVEAKVLLVMVGFKQTGDLQFVDIRGEQGVVRVSWLACQVPGVRHLLETRIHHGSNLQIH